jgi:hypothetical protein
VTNNSAIDSTPPAITGVSATGTTETGTTLNFTSDEAGNYFFLVLAEADAAPNAATVKAQGTAVAKGTGVATATAQTVAISGLSAGTSYKIYLIVEDAAGNLSAVSDVSVTSSAAAVVTPPASGGSGGGGGGVVQPAKVATPTSVSAVAGQSSVTLSWSITAAVGEVAPTSYRIELSTDDGTTWTMATVSGTGLTRTVTGLTQALTYVFRVVAIAENVSSTSLKSNPVSLESTLVTSPKVQKVTVGTFNGFVAIYTLGHEGSRLSAKVAGKWLVIDPIALASGKGYSLTRRKTGAGYLINVEVFIDRELVSSSTVTTR